MISNNEIIISDLIKQFLPTTKIKEQSNNKIKQENNQNNNITDSENSGKLIVTFENGTKLQYEKSVDTFIETIKKIGFEKVKNLNIQRCNGLNIIDTKRQRQDNKYSIKEYKNYFVIVHFNDEEKQKLLQGISDKLNLNLKVELLEDK